MIRYLFGRFLGLAAVLLVTSFVVFSAVHLAPGDPVSFLLKGHPVTPEARAAVRAQYHLDDPFLTQYLKWLGDVLHGDFGRSVQFRQDVGQLVGSRLGATAFLIGYAAILIAVGGVLLGTLAALRPGPIDRAVLVLTGVATATPPFVSAIGLVSLFSVQLGWFPGPGATGTGFTDRLYNLTLPAIALAVTLTGLLARVTRSAMLDELGREHVEVARSRGVAEGTLVRRHVLRNALGPIVNAVALSLSYLLGGVIIVETIFNYPGIAKLMVDAVATRDLPLIQSCAMIFCFVYLMLITTADVIAILSNPKLR